MKTRIVHTKFWYDQYISNLNSKEKLLFIYLICNDRVNICGMYELPDKYIKADLDLTIPELEKIKKKLQKDGKFFFDNGWIKIVNVDKYNRYAGVKNESARLRELELIPRKVIEYEYPNDTSIDTSNDTVSKTQDTVLNHNQKSEINNKKRRKKSYSSIKSITNVELKELSDKYNVPLPFVKSKFDDLVNYCESKGKTYRNYLAALRNFVKSDAVKIRKEAIRANSKSGIDARNIR